MGEPQRWFIYDFYIHLKKHFLVFRATAFWLLISPASLMAQSLSEQDSILVKQGFDSELSLGKPFFFADATHTKSFGQILHDSFSLPEKKFSASMVSPENSTTNWIKFDLENLSDSVLTLHIYPGYIDYTDLYLLSGKNSLLHLARGHLRNQQQEDCLAEEASGTIPMKLLAGQKGTAFLS